MCELTLKIGILYFFEGYGYRSYTQVINMVVNNVGKN